MPTVIDEFVAEFTVDPTAFTKGANNVRLNLKRVREDAGATGKDMELFGKRAGAMMGKLRNEALGLFLAFQGASSLGGFVSNLLTADAATARFAGNIGMTTNELSAWQLVIQGIGGKAEDANSALGAMANAYQSFLLTGTTGHDPDFRALGLVPGDLENPAEALLKIAEAGERLSRPEFYARLSRIGLPQSVINQLEEGRAATEALVEAKRKDGAATDADAAAAERFQRKLNDFQNHLTRMVRPAIYGVVDGLDDFLVSVDEGEADIPGLTLALGALAAVALTLEAPFVAAAAAIGAMVLAAQNWDEIKDTFTPKSGPNSPEVQATVDKYNKPGDPNRPWYEKAWDELAGLFTVHTDGGGLPAAAGASGPGGASPPAGGIEGYLRKKGFSGEQARGIAAGIQAESRGDPNAVNPTSGAYGIGQWLGSRKKELFRRYGNKPTMQQQLEFLVWELKGGDHGGASVTAQTSAEGAMVAYLRDFMRPGPGLTGDLKRGYRALGLRPNSYRGVPGASPQRVDNSTHIGSITIHTAKADPKAVADEIPAAISRRKVTTQANRGMQ